MGKTLNYIVLIASSIFFNNSVNAQVFTFGSIPSNDPLVAQIKNSNPSLKRKMENYVSTRPDYGLWDMVELGNPDLSFEGDARDVFEDQGKLFLKEWGGISKEKIVRLRTPSKYCNHDSKFNLDFKWDKIKAKHTFYNFRTNFKLNLGGAKVETTYSIPYNLEARAGVKWDFDDVKIFGGVFMPLSKTSNLSLTANSDRKYSRLMLGLRFNW